MRTPNAVFHLITRGREVPQGWGFPVSPGNRVAASGVASAMALRELLLPLADSEGFAQLIRWYHALLQSRPHVWRSIAAETEIYHPAAVYKPILEAAGVAFVADPDGGFLTLGWNWAGETGSLGAEVTVLDARTLRLRFESYTAVITHALEADDIRRIAWPEFMTCRAAIKSPDSTWLPGYQFHLACRVRAFDPAWLLSRLTDAHQRHLQAAGLLDAFHSAVNPLDKLAVIWLAVATLEPAPTPGEAILAEDQLLTA